MPYPKMTKNQKQIADEVIADNIREWIATNPKPIKTSENVISKREFEEFMDRIFQIAKKASKEK